MKKEQFRYLLSTIVVALILCVYNNLGEFVPLPAIALFFIIMIVSLVGRNMYKQLLGLREDTNRESKGVFHYLSGIQRKVYSVDDRIFFTLCFIGFSLCLLPAYIALFPGTLGYDGPVQLAQYFGEIGLTTHHPLLHTYLVGILLSLGDALFNSFTIGFAAYTAVQGLVVSGSLAYCALIAKRKNLNLPAIIAGFVYVLLNPFVQAITFNSTKDVLFGAFFLLFVAELINGSEAGKLSDYVRLVVFGVLMCLFRNQGIYIIVVLAVIALMFKLCRKEIITCLTGILAFVVCFNVVTTGILHIEKGDIREMLCVPMQQVAYVTSEYHEELTDKQMSLAEEVITLDGYASYIPSTADGVKNYFNTSELTDNFSEHLTNYIQLGIAYPAEYLQAWEWLVEDYWKLNTGDYRALAVSYTFEELNTYGIEHADLFNSYYRNLSKSVLTYDVSLLQTPGLCLWLMVLLVGIDLYKRNKLRTLVLVSYILYFGTILLGPVALIRYLYPITIATPLLLGLIFKNERN